MTVAFIGAGAGIEAAPRFSEPVYRLHPKKQPDNRCIRHTMSQNVFVSALLWRHRIRYAVEQFLWTGKMEQGFKKTVESNLAQPPSISNLSATLTGAGPSQTPDRIEAAQTVISLPRVSSEAALVSLQRQQQRAASPPPPSPQAALADADEKAVLPYLLPTNKMGYRFCGCHESKSCIHKVRFECVCASHACWGTLYCICHRSVGFRTLRANRYPATRLRMASGANVQIVGLFWPWQCGFWPSVSCPRTRRCCVGPRPCLCN